MSILVIAEHDNISLKPSTLHTITAARMFESPVNVLIAGHSCGSAAESAARIPGLASVFCCDDVRYAHFLAESLSFLVKSLAEQHTHILAPSTTFGKNFMPRVAALLDVQQISDVIAIKGLDTFVRPIYAGNALVEIKTTDPKKVLTIRGTAFSAVPTEGGAAAIDIVAAAEGFEDSRYISGELSKSVRPELTAAQVVVSGGRGMQGGENFKLLEVIADKLGGAIGASRAAVDAGFVSNDFQVGQTGKIVAPDLYIAVAISGAIQHLAGMKDSKVIVAINKDSEAPIFQVADYGLVADLFTALPELAEELNRQLG